MDINHCPNMHMHGTSHSHPVETGLSPSHKLQIRAWWYFVALLVERNEQRKQNGVGFVAIIYHVGSTKEGTNHNSSPTSKDWDIPLCYWNGLCSLQQLPLSIQEWHCCSHEESTLWMKPCFSFSSGTVFQGKDRTTGDGHRKFYFHQGNFFFMMWLTRAFHALLHCCVSCFILPIGSQTECLYKLLQCGIPAGDLPLMDDGTIDVTRHHQWMRDSIGRTTIM